MALRTISIRERGAGNRKQTVLPQGPQRHLPDTGGREEGQQFVGIPGPRQLSRREGGAAEESFAIISQSRAASHQVEKSFISTPAKAAGRSKKGVVLRTKVVKFAVPGN